MDICKIDVQELFNRIEEAGLTDAVSMQMNWREMDILYRVLFNFLNPESGE